MSTRRVVVPSGEVSFDHGAQYFTVRDPGFRKRVDAWVSQGCASSWGAAGADAFVGVPGMNAVIRQMAEPLSVHWGAKVIALSPDGTSWHVALDAESIVAVDALVVALPAEQAEELLRVVAPQWAARGRATPTAPCWTLMLAFDAPLPTETDCFRGDAAETLGWAARNSAKPGRSGPEAWVVQGGPVWSERHIEADVDWIAARLTEAFAEKVGVRLPIPIASTVHRWRYARSGAEGGGALWDGQRRLGLCGDWLIGPRVEAAWMSGSLLAQRIAEWTEASIV